MCYLFFVLIIGLYTILRDSILTGVFDSLMVVAIQIYFWYCVFMLLQLFRAEEYLRSINNSNPSNEPATDLSQFKSLTVV